MTNQEFVFVNINAADAKLADNIENGKSHKSPHLRALAAINSSITKTSFLLNKYEDKKESLFAVIERSLPSVIGATNDKKRKSIEKFLIAKGHDKKYVQQCLSRVFRTLFPNEKKGKGGLKSSPEVITFVDEALKEEGADMKALKKFFRAVSTEFGKRLDADDLVAAAEAALIED
mgnify:CR=1 FL=1